MSSSSLFSYLNGLAGGPQLYENQVLKWRSFSAQLQAGKHTGLPRGSTMSVGFQDVTGMVTKRPQAHKAGDTGSHR